MYSYLFFFFFIFFYDKIKEWLVEEKTTLLFTFLIKKKKIFRKKGSNFNVLFSCRLHSSNHGIQHPPRPYILDGPRHFRPWEIPTWRSSQTSSRLLHSIQLWTSWLCGEEVRNTTGKMRFCIWFFFFLHILLFTSVMSQLTTYSYSIWFTW